MTMVDNNASNFSGTLMQRPMDHLALVNGVFVQTVTTSSSQPQAVKPFVWISGQFAKDK